MASLSIRNLVKTTSTIQEQIGLAEIHEASQDQESFQALKNNLSININQAVGSSERIFKDTGKSPVDLAVRSRRAYQWLKYLAEEHNLENHLDALQRINLYLPKVERKKAFSNHQVNFLFYNLGSLYKAGSSSSTLTITAQEILILAPDRVLIAILESILGRAADDQQKLIKEYTFSPGYKSAREQLEYLGIEKGAMAAGNAYNLRDSYARVNQSYFNNNIPEPNLIWSSRLTHRKFGHYQWDTDTVMISKSLDLSSTPAFVVDYVMFHELLHKKLGANLINQRRAVHTKQFRQEEARFKKIDQAQRWLNKLSRKRK